MTTRRTPGRGRPGSGTALLLASLSILFLSACANHTIYHPKKNPPGITTWSEQVVRGRLLLRLRWAKPEGPGPFPAVLVHPEANHEAREMRGVIRELAAAGYLAVAADYKRMVNGVVREPLFTWQDPDDPRALLDLVRRRPDVDPERIGAIGFSQGGVYSLLIAAYTGQIRAVVAYYPVTDFSTWLREAGEGNAGRRFVFRLIRRSFRKQTGAKSDAELDEILGRASAMRQAEAIRAPVLLIHGDRDTSAPLAESERLAAKLRELRREVELVVVPDAGHVFNWMNREQARISWEPTLRWLDRHLSPAARAF
jgi:dipeptidyl aminopeptidase/acylaminoacyl peptidase